MSDKSLQRKKDAFLAAFRTCGVISRAAEAAQISRQNHYDWLKDDSTYADAFAKAEKDAAEFLEIEARRRATAGVQKVVLYKGEPVMVPSDLNNPTSPKVPLIEHEYSDTLLIFLMKGAMPEKYRENVAVDHTTGGKPMKAFLDIDAAKE